MPSLSIPTPIGHLTITASEEAIVGIRWADDPAGQPTPLLKEAARQLQAYFAGRLVTFDLPLAARGSTFERRVWDAMCAIPFGETRTYGDLAHAVDSGPRAIGGACGKNPIPIIVPCHRVLARGGLGGYSGGAGLPTKQFLLGLESRLRKAA
ncbi:MAG TPA: methylated-DNA--[protein]-cysteine S-methyltransferase [Stellaceae bacterium]|jgi:methylated-DNA-[protein]-cysteine S-methyltransferase|nr:methylated-DNA--[protein]-cysteine S-methyltransferase [Stellaceae bacterium]